MKFHSFTHEAADWRPGQRDADKLLLQLEHIKKRDGRVELLNPGLL